MNILICEDERLIALDLKNSLTRMGHKVVCVCHTAPDLIEMSQKIDPDLILTDISLKGTINGIDAIKKIKEWKEVPFMYISGLKDEETYKSALKTNPFAFISKPFNYYELKYQIDRCSLKTDISFKIEKQKL